MADIFFRTDTDDYIFSYRVGGVRIHNRRVLIKE